MKKFLSLFCSVFVLYSATFINSSFASGDESQCQLTRYSPSMIVASMEAPVESDISDTPFSISVIAERFAGFQYNLTSCFFRTNIGGKDEESNTYEVSMRQFTDPSQPIINFIGESKFHANAIFGKFEVYCPVISPNLERENVTMSVVVQVGCKTFTQSSSSCKFHPYNSFAEKTEVESDLSLDKGLVVKITNLHHTIPKDNFIFVGFTPTDPQVPEITLGTTNEYFFLSPDFYKVQCTVNGKASLARGSKSGTSVKIALSTTLEIHQDYVINCSNITSFITSGSIFIPSIVYVSTNVNNNHSIAKNVYV